MSRRRRWALAGVSLFLTVGSALALDEVMWQGSHAAAMASAVSDAILDPGSIFAARSPGARGSGLLLQTKHDRVAPAAYVPPPGLEGPAERVLAGIRERPPETDLLAPPPPAPLVQTLPQFAMGGPPPGPAGVFPGSPLAFPPGGGFLPLANTPPPGDTPPGGGGPPPGDSPPGGPPLSPVPEPAAWILMTLAVFGLGSVLRWRRSKRPEAAGLNA
ncbi:MAG: PEP-CTERM sorting domain-containing protein [Caulobacteraceae bacterium]